MNNINRRVNSIREMLRFFLLKLVISDRLIRIQVFQAILDFFECAGCNRRVKISQNNDQFTIFCIKIQATVYTRCTSMDIELT